MPSGKKSKYKMVRIIQFLKKIIKVIQVLSSKIKTNKQKLLLQLIQLNKKQKINNLCFNKNLTNSNNEQV